MATLCVAVAILKDGRILLVKREDFEIWSLPGGHVESGESVAQAAIREVREETGLRVTPHAIGWNLLPIRRVESWREPFGVVYSLTC